MITKEQCRLLGVGDYIFFMNSWRRINDTGQHPRGNILYFYFDKLRSEGQTIYTNYDLKHKVKAVLKLKR